MVFLTYRIQGGIESTKIVVNVSFVLWAGLDRNSPAHVFDSLFDRSNVLSSCRLRA